jgi:hypothetical protein
MRYNPVVNALFYFILIVIALVPPDMDCFKLPSLYTLRDWASYLIRS